MKAGFKKEANTRRLLDSNILTSMKLRFIIPDPDSFPSGGNLYNAQLIQALSKKNVDVQIIDFEQFRINKREEDAIYFLDSLYLDEIRHSNTVFKNGYLIVHHLESLYPGEMDSNEVFEKKERLILKRFDGFLTSSEYTKQYLINKGLTDQQYLVLIPALGFQPELTAKSTDSIKAAIVSNIVHRKGIHPFLEAIRQSDIHPEKCQIQIAGSPNLEPVYAQKCLDLISANEKLSKIVKYLGPCTSHQVEQLYRQSNLFISPSFMETFGMALQEAVAYRLPVLAIDGGNAKYHVEKEKNGYIFSSMASLVKKLEILSQDDQTFKKLLESAWVFRKFEQYSWEDAAELFLQKLNQNVAGRI